MGVVAIVFCLIWLYLLRVCKKAELGFFFYLLGSVGMFIFLMIWVRPILTEPLTWIVTSVTGSVGELSGMFDAYPDLGMLFIPKDTAAVSLYIDFECSGVIEIMAFLSLLWFFNIYNIFEKTVVSICGVLWIFFSNVARLLVISTMVYGLGNDSFYFAHAIAGRIIFYFLSIVLYFYVFTKAQVIRQKVGGFSYQKKVTKQDIEVDQEEGDNNE